MAKIYVVRAEGFITKADELKAKKISFSDRGKFYAEACIYFEKAYDSNPDVFTLARIDAAIDTCWKAEKPEQEDKFKQFEDEYVKRHPQEYEYGDSGAGMMDMGG